MSTPANPVSLPLAQYSPQHFLLAVADGVATVTLNRPERKNPLTFESYRELTDFFRACAIDDDVKTVVPRRSRSSRRWRASAPARGRSLPWRQTCAWLPPAP